MIKIALVLAILTTPVLASGDKGPTPGNGWGAGGSKQVKGVPIPMAGAGLIPLALLALWWARRERA